jgi:hypothetical protein
MPEGAGGGGPPMSDSAPSYVEPNPVAFYRMAYIAEMLACGLQNHVNHHPCTPDSWRGRASSDNINGYIAGMSELGNRFKTLGDIAAKELAGLPLSSEENNVIAKCLGMTECLNLETPYNRPAGEMPKVPVVAAVSGAGDKVLEVGVGNVDRIYVVVPLEDKWEVAQGGVFSYYEFSQPRDQRLTDDEWRAELANGAVTMPSWTSNLILPGGQPAEILFFRVGDWYIITEAGDKLNLRDQPSTKGKVIMQLKPDEYVKIVEGPVRANGYTWWKFTVASGIGTEITGWAVEDQSWYVRSYLP